MIVSITGIGWVTPTNMGSGRDYKSLADQDGRAPKLTSKMIFGKTSIHFGRLDDYSKLGFAAITFALRDARLEQWYAKRPIGIIASTTYGCLATDIDYYETVMPEGGAFASPSLFAYTLPNVFLGEAATRYGLTGETFVINEPELSGIVGLRMALNAIVLDDCPVMLAGLCDSGRPELFDYPAQVSPGALFFVLEKSPEHEDISYGVIDMESTGTVFFKGRQVKNLRDLMHRCVAVKSV
jgi:3-oxoacyl-[acyl-carrier-protein] synthase II